MVTINKDLNKDYILNFVVNQYFDFIIYCHTK